MKNLQLIGRIIYAVPMAVFGLNHFMMAEGMKAMVPAFIPGGIFWVYVTGLALIAAAVAIIANRYASLASLLLGILLAIFALTIHLPGSLNPETMQMFFPNLLKDTSLSGAALVLSVILKK